MALIKNHAKILEAKQKAAPITYSSIVVDTQGRLNMEQLNQGIVEGYAIIWGERSLTGFKFLKGCCSRSLSEHGVGSKAHYQIKFLNQHNQDDPMSLFAELNEDDIGLHFKTVPLDLWDLPGSSAYRLIAQLKSKTINNFSHGYDWVWDKTEYDDSDDSLVAAEIKLFEISAVTIPAGLKTRQVQSLEQLGDVQDEINSYINTLPAKFRMQARQLFALQHSLINLDSFEQQKKTIAGKTDDVKPTAIDYSDVGTYNNLL